MERCLPLFLFFCLTLPALAQESIPQREDFHAAAEYFDKLGTLLRYNTEQAAPAVVSIRVTRTQPAGRVARQPRLSEELGSGIVAVIAGKQVILTNRHVIADAERDSIEIMTYDRRLLVLNKIAANEDFDIAVLEVAEELPQPARLGNSDQVHIGEIVLALGNPFGLDRSVSMGVISAVGRREVPGASGSVPRISFFQTDAAVNPGSSGGMLLNVRGEVIGLVTAIATQGGSNEGVAFVMPINAVLRIAEQLAETGTAVKPYIGFAFESAIPPETRHRLGISRIMGAQIRSVEADSPAEQAGLKAGDVLMMFGNTEVEDGLHVIHLVAQSEIDQPTVMQVNRNGERLHVTVTPIAQLSR